MDISVFCRSLYSEMTKIGITEEKADKYVLNLRKNLKPEDVAGVTERDIPKYAKICADNIAKTAPKESPADETLDDNIEFDESILLDEAESEDMSSATRIYKKADTSEIEDAESEDIIPNTEGLYDKPSRGGTAKFIGITAVSSPLWIVAFAIFFAPFIIMFAAEFAIIAAFISLLAGCTALGTAASLTGIVYGVVKMFSTPAVGLYEIGFGVIIAGVAMICGILIYNGAVRFMPWLIKRSARLFKFTFSKIKPLLTEYKRRCEKL